MFLFGLDGETTHLEQKSHRMVRSQDVASSGSFRRITDPALLYKRPNFISQLRVFITIWPFWSDDKFSKFGGTDMTQWNIVVIELMKAMSPEVHTIFDQ